MSDIFCAVCAEPWESYGHGDMMRWQWELFRAGAGCPCCEGVPSDDESTELATESHFRSVVFGGTDDPDSFGLIHGDARPAWVEPPEPTIVKCTVCAARLVAAHETNEPEWRDLPRHRGWRDYRDTDPESFVEIDSESVCGNCIDSCRVCDAPVYSDQSMVCDHYSPGGAVQKQEGMGIWSLCGDCVESACLDCFDSLEDCTCDEDTWRYLDLRERIASCVQQRITIFSARRDDPPAGWSREY